MFNGLEQRVKDLEVRTSVLDVSQKKDFQASQTALELNAREVLRRIELLSVETERLKSFSDNLLGKQSIVTFLVAAFISFLVTRFIK